MKAVEALQTILDSVDYTSGACSVTDMVGAVLQVEVIQMAKVAISEANHEELARAENTGTFYAIGVPFNEWKSDEREIRYYLGLGKGKRREISLDEARLMFPRWMGR